MEGKAAWIVFQRVFGFGTARAQKVLDRFHHPRQLFSMAMGDLLRELGPTPAEETRLREVASDMGEKVLDRCEKLGCAVLTPDDEGYPDRLQHIFSPPSVLYVLGDISDIDETLAIAVVGTRRNSEYGQKATESIAGDLAVRGVTVVSGMAYGIDSICHAAVVKRSGRTVAVWGTGIDKPYPAENRELAKAILRCGGAIVTEFPPGQEPRPFHFPIRNRIISGLCQGTLVVEGSRKSGSLITAGHALTQGRDVFAVPGSVFSPMSQGPNWLITQGAIMARSSEDILGEYAHLLEKPAVEEKPNSRRKRGAKPDRPPASGKPASIDSTPEFDNATAFDNGDRNGYNVRKNAPKADPAPSQSTLKLLECLSETQRQVFEALEETPLSSEQIMAKSGLGVAAVLATLTQLEIFGLATVHPGRLFSR